MFPSKIISAALRITSDESAWVDILEGYSAAEIHLVADCLEQDGQEQLADDIRDCAWDAADLEG